MSRFEQIKADPGHVAAYVETARGKAGEIADIPADTPKREIRHVGIIGAGTMGGGIAMSFANVGIPVIVLDVDDAALERGMARVRENYAHSVRRGRLAEDDVQRRLSLITTTTRYEDLKPVDLVIEAVFEDMELKQSIFGRLDETLQPGAILATNTSGLDIDEIARTTRRPQDVVGAHFFSPAHVQKLLEVVRGKDTASDVIATLMALGERLGKVSLLARNYPGFIGNALFRHYIREAHFLVEEGALPHDVDAALEAFGYAMGVFKVHDMAGNDVGWQMRKKQMATRPTDRRWNDLILKLCDMGRFGQKSGKGWYRYEPGDRTPHRDPELEAFIVAESARLGIERRPISSDEIIERYVFSMINEGARLLELGIAQRASDIDITFLTGYGFPRALGGPMYFADLVGLDVVYDTVQRFHERHGYWWTPSPLLKELATSGGNFGTGARRA